MDRFLEKLNLPRLNQEELEIMNNPITSNEIEAVIKNLPTTKAQDQMASQENSIKHLRKANAYPSSSVQFSCSIVSDSLRPHELQHARPCPSPIRRVHPDSRPSSQ